MKSAQNICPYTGYKKRSDIRFNHSFMPYAFVSWRLRKILPVEIIVISPSQAVTDDDVLPEITDMEEAMAEALDEHAGIYIFQFKLIYKKAQFSKEEKDC